jgi:TolA-binding protein
MKFTVWALAGVVLAGLFWAPAPANGQNKDILAVQRDIYEVNRKLDELKTAQEGRSSQAETLLKQLTDANQKLAADLKALQDSVKANQSEQQRRVFEPVAVLKSDVEDMSGNMAGIQAALTTLRGKQDKMEGMLTDLAAAVRLLATQPPPAATAPETTSVNDSAALLFAAAQRDKLAGKLQNALDEFNEIGMKFPMAPEAPMAVFEMGSLYAHNEQFEDALKAYDRVLEQFGDNPMRKDAQFLKAEQLASLGKRSEAAREYDVFAKAYPADDMARTAIERATELRRGGTGKAKAVPAKGKRAK